MDSVESKRYHTYDRDISTAGIFEPFKDAKTVGVEASLPCTAKNSRSCSHHGTEASSEERKWMHAVVKTLLTRTTVNTIISLYCMLS